MGKSKKFRTGDQVTWKSHGSTAEGRVEKKISERTTESGRTVDATPRDPQYKVRSDKSGRSAVHRAQALRKKKD